MKKSLGKKLGVVLILATFIVAILSVFVLNAIRKKDGDRVLSAVFSDSSTAVSAKLPGDILLSAEKVLVTSSGEEKGKNVFMASKDDNGVVTTQGIYFENNEDRHNAVNKYVIADGEFVKLDNKKEGSDFVDKTNRTVDGVKAEEAILISFGHYFLENGSIYGGQNNTATGASKDKGNLGESKVRWLEVSGTVNGTKIEGLQRRDISVQDGPFYDFAYLIRQKDAEEGYYEFTFSYGAGEADHHNQKFGFNLLFDTSYTQVVNVDKGYTAQPILGWTEDSKDFKETLPEGKSYIRYYDGLDGISTKDDALQSISYPTITYDYFKFRMTYTHTYNKVTTTYTYTTSNSNGIELVINSSSVNGSSSRRQTMKYVNENAANLVTIMFTKPGEYTFSFDYLYNNIVPNGVKFDNELNNEKLIIHGLELNYSRPDYRPAVLRHYELSTDANSKVNLVVANGVPYGQEDATTATSIDFVYTLNAESEERAGNVINSFDNKNGSRDALINAQLKASNNNGEESDYEYLTEGLITGTEPATIKNLANNYINSTLDKVLNSIKYVKTNQASFYFYFNSDSYNKGFYFYSQTKPSLTVLKETDKEGNETGKLYNALFNKPKDGEWLSSAQEYHNQTSFNKVGYYLVFMEVSPLQSGDKYYQIFAFQYSADSVDIKIVDNTANKVPVSNFTNKNIIVSWQESDLFEKKLTSQYFIAYDNNASQQELLAQRPQPLENGQELGATVVDGHFAKILIKINNDSNSSTSRIVTIDRAKIENVFAYVVQKSTTPNGDIVYSIDMNKNGTKKVLESGITDSYVALNWQEENEGRKNSGANITAKYYRTPFVETNDPIQYNQNMNWISTKYKLGSEVGPFADYIRPTSDSQVRNVFSKRGIYRVVLTDDAGNSCQYIFVIDDTAAYYQVTNELVTNFYTGEKVVFTSDTSFNVGNYKNIVLGSETELKEENPSAGETAAFILALTNNDQTKLKELGLYLLNPTYTSKLRELFKRDGSSYNLIVENKSITAYDSQDVIDTALSNKWGTITDAMKGNATSAVRHLYLYAKNNEFSSKHENTRSHLTIEVNTDNSLGMVYYSGQDIDFANVPTDGKDSNADKTIIRLETGSDNTGETKGLLVAHATSAEHLVFTWKMGVGDTAVASVTYKWYPLTVDSYDGKYYFYNQATAKEEIAYANNSFNEPSAGKNADGSIGYVSFDIGSSTPEGLYVVTRSYSGNGTDTDSKVKKYYFIVDRKGAIEAIGNEVYIQLLEEEGTKFTNFNRQEDKTKFKVTHVSKVSKQEEVNNFTLCLVTNKVPATLNVPVAKFVDSKGNFANYYSGRLTATLYYAKTENDGFGDPIYRGEVNIDEYNGSAFYDINIAKYLEENNADLYKTFIKADIDGDWLYLNGIYCLVLEDNVRTITTKGITNNKKVIGFKIKQEEFPEIEIESGYTLDNLNSSNVVSSSKTSGSFNFVTNEEYIQFVLPVYEDGKYQAQVDPEYLEVVALSDDKRVEYISFKNKTGLRDEDTFTTTDGNTLRRYLNGTINLNTRLGLDGEYNQTDKLIYEITIRFRISDGSNKERYMACYTIDGKKYFESVYRIEIDRVAPSKNINYLTERDAEFIEYYNAEHGVKSMFVDAEHNLHSQRFYTKQYTAYYSDSIKTMSKVYAFNVLPTDTLEFEQDSKIRFRSLDPKDRNITLPVVNENEYQLGNIKEKTYSDLLSSNDSDNFGLYEFIEIDKAGNVAQYIVNYTNSSAVASVTFGGIEWAGNYKGNTLTITTDEQNETNNVTAIEGLTSTFNNSSFFRFELLDGDGNLVYENNTNFLTSNATVAREIANKIKLKLGNYVLKIVNPYKVVVDGENVKLTKTITEATINLYQKDGSIRLNKDNLLFKESGKHYLNLTGANVKVEGVWYFAADIYIEGQLSKDNSTYVKRYEMKNIIEGQDDAILAFEYNDYLIEEPGNNKVEGEIVNNLIPLEDGVYRIVMKDVFENEYILRFATSGDQKFYTISPIENYNLYYENDIYFSFNSVKVYHSTIFNEKVVVKYKLDDELAYHVVKEGNVINEKEKVEFIKFDGQNILITPNKGHLLEVTITFAENEEYNIVIDGTLANVELREYLTGNIVADGVVNTHLNQNDMTILTAGNRASGRMTLILNKDQNGSAKYKGIYQYVYTLYQEGETEPKVITQDYENIITDKGESEQYWLRIDVHAKDGTYLGNIIHAFKVETTSTSLFTVLVKENEEAPYVEMEANATFKYDDLKHLIIDSDWLPDELNNVSLPLYVMNIEEPEDAPIVKNEEYYKNFYTVSLEAGANEDDVITCEVISDVTYRVRLHKISTGTYQVLFGVLLVPKTENVIESLKIKVADKDYLEITDMASSVIIPAMKTDSIVLEGTRTQKVADPLVRKNILKMDVYFDNILVKSIEFNNMDQLETFSQEIFGNGEFTYVIYDLAGNVQKFEKFITIDDKDVCALEIIPLREVIAKIKQVSEDDDYIPLDNAFYSEGVELRLYASYLYKNGSISVVATRNGEPYEITRTAPYLFSEYGTYRVKISAEYVLSSEKSLLLEKVIMFTIVNEQEARKSIDLGSINDCNITKVLNNFGEDVTENFKNTILAGASYVSYDAITENAKAINATFGKNKFTVFYEYNDGIYPKRELSFAFTLNNELPEIECSIQKGETTTKGFDISFNAGVIYEQIGEAYIYINDRLVAEINAESPYDIQTISTTFKEFGAGDYYVQVITASGNVISSYKVTIKEPLNVWAIIVIVVVSVIVITVTTVVLVLRHKMRIR